MENHRCGTPSSELLQYGEQWKCPTCGKLWEKGFSGKMRLAAKPRPEVPVLTITAEPCGPPATRTRKGNHSIRHQEIRDQFIAGVRPSRIASLAGVSKQAVFYVIKKLIEEDEAVRKAWTEYQKPTTPEPRWRLSFRRCIKRSLREAGYVQCCHCKGIAQLDEATYSRCHACARKSAKDRYAENKNNLGRLPSLRRPPLSQQPNTA